MASTHTNRHTALGQHEMFVLLCSVVLDVSSSPSSCPDERYVMLEETGGFLFFAKLLCSEKGEQRRLGFPMAFRFGGSNA